MFHLTVGTKKSFSISKDDKTGTGEISLGPVPHHPKLRRISVRILNTGGISVQNVDVLPAQGTLRNISVNLLDPKNAWELTLVCKWLLQDLFKTEEEPAYQS